jgi:hypothetical protein
MMPAVRPTDWVWFGPLALVPAAAFAALLLARPAGRRSAFGAVSGAGLLLLYVAYVNRAGPGTTCWRTATANACDEHLNPMPWLAIGVLLVITGLVAHARATRTAG